jgi:hypothetical protein
MAKHIKADIVGVERHHVGDNATPLGGYKKIWLGTRSRRAGA